MNDVKKHLATSKHQEMAKAVSSSESLKAFFRPSPIEEAITRAAVLFANFVAEHNLSFMVADHFTHLTSVMFPDSKIAEAFGSARTKTTCIVKGALHPHYSNCDCFKLDTPKELLKKAKVATMEYNRAHSSKSDQ